MVDHPTRARVAEIMVVRADPSGEVRTRGSGYLVSPGWVLTACHVVRGAVSIAVWLGAPAALVAEEGEAVEVKRVLTVPDADLALLPVRGQAGETAAEPALFGRLNRDAGPPVPAAAAGCPRFTLRPAPGRDGVLLRELAYAIGGIAALSDAKTGRFAFVVDAPPAPESGTAGHSPWEGMSGAAVWAGNRLIGVVGQHHPREGLATLTFRPIERLFGPAPEDQLDAWRAALPHLPAHGNDLWLATPPTPRKIDVARARWAVEALAPRVLIGRGAELAALADFTASGARWRWIQGDPFAGKTALLAWFALHPPERVDVVACFLRRASDDENTAGYALDVLSRQLALLADRGGYTPPSYVSERKNDFADLLEEAARACAERGRGLLVLVDGLDEYDAAAGLDLVAWLPDSRTLPGTASLLVASRAGVSIRFPAAHPLRDQVRRITASEAATGIRLAAQAELGQVLRVPGGFLFPLVSSLAAAGSGLTASELQALLKRRGRDLDVSEIEALLGSSLNRSLTCLHDPDTEGEPVYVFAHETLLAEARVRFGADRAAYEDLIDAWAREYAQLAWPPDAPRYLLRSYTRELGRRAQDPGSRADRRQAAAEQLFRCALDADRRRRLRERLGNDLAALSELDEAQLLNRVMGGADLGRATRLAQARDALSGRGPAPSAAALTVLAVQDRRRALAVALGAGDWAVAVVAGELVRTAQDDLEQASTVTHLIESVSASAPALCELALAQQARGQLAAAEESAAAGLDAARAVAVVDARVSCLLQVAATLATVGLAAAAEEACADAIEAARHIPDDRSRVVCLLRIAGALASTGGPSSARSVMDEAVALARGVEDPARRAALLTAIVSSDSAGLISPDDHDGLLLDAARAAENVTSVEGRPRALASVALAQVRRGVPYESSLEKALALADEVEYPKFHAEILQDCATVLAEAGRRERAEKLLAEAVRVADNYSLRWDEYTWWRRADTLSSLACAQARQGFHQSARDTVTAHLVHQKQDTLARIADIQIEAGALAEAATTIQLMADPDLRTPSTGRLACARVQAGDPAASSMLDEFVSLLTAANARRNVGEGLGYAALAAHYLARAQTARELAEMSLATRRPLDPLERSDVLLGVGRAYAAAGNRERAARHLEEALTAAESPDAGDDPIRRERFDKAIAAAAVALAEIGEYATALDGVARLRSSIWPGWRQKPEAYTAIAVLLAQAGRTTDASSTFALAVTIALQRFEPFEAHRTGSVIASIALAQARVGSASAAWSTAEELREVELAGGFGMALGAERCLAKLAQYYAAAGRHDDARKTFERIRDDRIRGEIEPDIGDGLEAGPRSAAPPTRQTDPLDDWETRARQTLDEWEPKRITLHPGSGFGEAVLELAETARLQNHPSLAVRLVAVAFALLPCHQVLAAACAVEPALSTVLEELEPW
ncbi:trypsin-like peptidase domain-containing protein [Frankia sp. AgB1.9]|uniref:trypsin-like peptidase domain-containing protein n=1 Tax=unclassified Frankia TaxID=2632575 RepID=UPI00193346BE|nr:MULTISPECIES: trypsin-like peptidase domain-containing protein [unclassified Frankia]MBL7494140.1 trypsin-like peptidase domain-containing protein [Frankia sp. AgW1.1]MBL7548903.1 trypsin-like peptidase domain-containing protein [Frankia sp. AgB1.9]MBL7625208.1 trypsin-like peptidase domain-containing protein [Frankia sp. AgB1.8]